MYNIVSVKYYMKNLRLNYLEHYGSTSICWSTQKQHHKLKDTANTAATGYFVYQARQWAHCLITTMEEHKAYINFLCQHGVFQLTLGSWLGSITLPLVSSTLYTGCGVDDCPASVAADRVVVYGGPRGLISSVLNNCR